jgi:hypothetical protein
MKREIGDYIEDIVDAMNKATEVLNWMLSGKQSKKKSLLLNLFLKRF